MTIKADWDMNVNLKKLQDEVYNNPKKFYNNF